MSSPTPAHPRGTGRHRLFVYGSCVARDTFELMSAERFSLARYVARQSLVSAYAPVRADGGDAGTAVSFGERMVAEDGVSSLLPLLAQEADRIAGLVWDLTDERLGVYRVGDGYVTRSVDLVTSGRDSALAEQYPHIPFGTPEHLERWTGALDRFVTDLRTLGLLDRTLLLAVPWAERTATGAPTGPTMSFDAATANRLYAPYYAAARERGVPVHELPVSAVRADPGHQWGEAPFHYDERTYDTIRRAVETRLAPQPDDVPDPQFARRFGWDRIVDPWVDSLPVRADRVPGVYRIWLSARRYRAAGNLERARLCEQLITVLHSASVPAELELGEDVEFRHGGIGVTIEPGAEVERGVTLGPHVTIAAGSGPARFSERRGRPVRVPRIEPFASIGAGATIVGGITVGAFGVVAPGSVVTRDVPAGTVTGDPPEVIDETSVARWRGWYAPLRSLPDDELVATFRHETSRSATTRGR